MRLLASRSSRTPPQRLSASGSSRTPPAEALGKWVQQNAPADVYGLPSWSTLLKAVVNVDPCLARKLASKYQCKSPHIEVLEVTDSGVARRIHGLNTTLVAIRSC